jgi:hypothetical protein
LVVLLGGCSLFVEQEEPVAVAPEPVAEPEPEAPALDLPRPRPADLEERYAALQADPPAVNAETLIGMDFESLRQLLGAPNRQQERAPAEIWVYSGEDCDLQVFFYPQVGGDDYRALVYEVAQKAELPSELTANERENACLSALLAERLSGGSVV